MKSKPKFLLLGWDSADWKVINPLIDKGLMPALESIINKGVMGNIATLDPPLSPMLWTSIATGKYAYKHGVHGFLEGADQNTKIRAVTNGSIKTSTLWQILNKNGYKTNVVGWWPSHPAEELNGAQVSNFYGKSSKESKWNDWKKVPNSVFPLELDAVLNDLRVHPGELDVNQLVSFIPNYNLLKEEDAKLVSILLSDFAQCLSVHNAATYLAENTEWDFMAVYYNAIDHVSHCFMKYHPPKLAWVSDEKFEVYNLVIEAIYRFHDLMLARWLELVDDDCYVMVLSDHGFHSDHLRVQELPKEPAAIAREHNYLGMMAIKGPNLNEDEMVFGSNLLDITPTILSLFDIPIGEDMDGKVLNAIYKQKPTPKFISTWDTGTNFKNNQSIQLFENDELVKQLVDLGYVEATNFDSPDEVKKLLDENNFYLARAYIDGAKHYEAGIILKRLCTDYQDNHRYLITYAQTLIELKETDLLAQAIENLAKLITNGAPIINLFKGQLAFLKQDYKMALSIFEAIGNSGVTKNKVVEYQIATSFLKLKKYDKAIKHYDNNLLLNPNNAYALQGKGMAYLELKKYDKAIDVLIDAISLTYFNPSAHYYLGLAFKEIGAYEEAEKAFLVAKQLAPNMSKARLELVNLYANHLIDELKLKQIEEEMIATYKGTIYIVSGLPRSGTSLMMQMLEAGGLAIFTDNKRMADTDNPKGYYEHEAIKNLALDNRIVKEANGKCVKVISSLLKFLPAHYQYKVILMKRDVNQVLASQEIMLANSNKIKKGDSVFEMDKILKESYEASKLYMQKSPNFQFLEIEYQYLVKNPELSASKVNSFLQLELNTQNMAAKVDLKLHRNK